MTYPLGRSADEAAYERARLERRQNEAQLEWIELWIAGGVTRSIVIPRRILIGQLKCHYSRDE